MTSLLSKPYIKEVDDPRLVPNMEKVRLLMEDQKWRTLGEIAEESGLRAESVSAHVRDLRKAKNGSYVVDRRARGSRVDGLFEYRILPPGTTSAYSGAAEPRKKMGKGFLAGMMFAAKVVLKASDLKEAKLTLREELMKASDKKPKEKV
jgi:hypothetical protein